jgi:hypothetical protein
MPVKYLFYLREVSLDDVGHPRETLQQPRHLLLECLAEAARNLGPHRVNHCLDLLLVGGILSEQRTLELHNRSHDHLQLVCVIRLGLLLQEVVVS